MPNSETKPITHVDVHMYKMGTGDCFVLKFISNDETTFNMVIDCGYTGNQDDFRPTIENIKDDVGNHINALVITHEHNDHVKGFKAGEETFIAKAMKVDQVWMGWSEKDGDEEVEKWKQEYGEKKMALFNAATLLRKAVDKESFKSQFDSSKDGDVMFSLRKKFIDVLEDFTDLHVDRESVSMGADGVYKGLLSGMKVVKDKIKAEVFKYFEQGEVIKDFPGLDGIRIFVLAPPKLYEEVHTHPKDDKDAYKHNEKISDSDLLVHALNLSDNNGYDSTLSPFDQAFVMKSKQHKSYNAQNYAWRRIDYDWLFSSGAFALRMNSLTNNLSLCLAIEFIESKKVMLFTGDAEFGSWKSWHDIDWKDKAGIDIKTKDLLKKVVFYKVSHHLSHNGTAKELGLEMMTSPDLCAMVSLDYKHIGAGWKSTMPNRLILKELLEKTKGRLMVINEDGLHYDLNGEVLLSEKITDFRKHMTTSERNAFNENLDDNSTAHYVGYKITI